MGTAGGAAPTNPVIAAVYASSITVNWGAVGSLSGYSLEAYTDPGIRRWHARSVETEVEARSLIERWRSAWSAESGANWAVVRAEGSIRHIVPRGSKM